MARWLRSALVLLVLATWPGPVRGQLSVAPRIGTLGLGLDLGLALAPVVTARAGVGFVPIEPSGTYDDVSYDLSIPASFTLGLDLHPGGGGFRVSGGVMMQSDDLSLESTPTDAVDLGGTSFSPAEVGTLRGEVRSSDVSPFVALGFGAHGRSGVGLFLDLGVGFLGDPEVELSADGALSGDPVFEAAVQVEEDRLEDELDMWGRFYPIVNLGVRIGFGS